MCVCVFVCVCEDQQDTDRERKKGSERQMEVQRGADMMPAVILNIPVCLSERLTEKP